MVEFVRPHAGKRIRNRQADLVGPHELPLRREPKFVGGPRDREAVAPRRQASLATRFLATFPTPRPPPPRSSAASPIAGPRPACCLPRSRQSRIAGRGRADRERRTCPPPRCAA